MVTFASHVDFEYFSEPSTTRFIEHEVNPEDLWTTRGRTTRYRLSPRGMNRSVGQGRLHFSTLVHKYRSHLCRAPRRRASATRTAPAITKKSPEARMERTDIHGGPPGHGRALSVTTSASSISPTGITATIGTVATERRSPLAAGTDQVAHL